MFILYIVLFWALLLTFYLENFQSYNLPCILRDLEKCNKPIVF